MPLRHNEEKVASACPQMESNEPSRELEKLVVKHMAAEAPNAGGKQIANPEYVRMRRKKAGSSRISQGVDGNVNMLFFVFGQESWRPFGRLLQCQVDWQSALAVAAIYNVSSLCCVPHSSTTKGHTTPAV